MVTPGILSVVGDSSSWTGGSVTSGVGRVSLVGITFAAGGGVAGAAQALMSNGKAINRVSLNFIIHPLVEIDFPLTMISW